ASMAFWTAAATGTGISGAFASSSLPTALTWAERIAPRIATPSAAPSWRTVLLAPEPMPALAGGMSERTRFVSWAIASPVKLHYSRARDPRRKWRETILRERAAVERILDDSPSLRREIPAMIDKEADRAADLALTGLSARGEIARSSRAKPLDRPFSYTPDQILGYWFPPEPRKPTRRAR